MQQLADNKIRLIQEQEGLEQKQMELFGIRLPEDQMNSEIEDATSFWLSPTSLRWLVDHYLQSTCGKEQEYILGDKPLKTLRLSQEARNMLLHDFQKLPKQNGAVYRDWENWLKGGSAHFTVTFDTGCAVQNSDAAFIMPLHPVVKQAALLADSKQRIVTNLVVNSDEVPAGQYEFAIYQWRFHGIREDLILQPIASAEVVTEHLGRLLEIAVDYSDATPAGIGALVWDELDTQHYTLWVAAKAKHRQQTQKMAEYRRESLTTSHGARIALLEEQLKQATNEKIQKMRQSQIETAEADYARHIQELDIAMERADIIAGAVAYGVITVSGEKR